MPALRHLAINFQLELASSMCVWNILAKAPAIPTLKELNLDTCIMIMGDFTTFVGKCCSTWTSLTFSHIHLCNGTKEELGDLYERLSQAPSLELYRQRYFYLRVGHQEHIGMPGQVCCVAIDDRENEDDFVKLYKTDCIHRKGRGEVAQALSVMADHMRS